MSYIRRILTKQECGIRPSIYQMSGTMYSELMACKGIESRKDVIEYVNRTFGLNGAVVDIKII